MSGIIPFEPGDPEQRIATTLNDVRCVVRARWNTLEASWYLDIYESDGKTFIAAGLKLVLGVLLGRRLTHQIFAGGLFAVDESGANTEAGLLDLGARVTVWYLDPDDLFLATQPDPVTPPVPS